MSKSHNIIVSAGASRESGAKTIYLQFLKYLSCNVSENRYYVFIDYDMPCPEITGVTYIKINVRSNIQRLKFDFYDCRKILKRLGVKPDLIISLQNTGIFCLRNIHQIIYYHQSLPLYPQNWNPLKKRERTLAFYKYIYPFFVRISFLKRKVDFIAQIPFIKDGIVKRFNIADRHVHVLFPDTERINPDEIKYYNFEENTFNFIYPSTAFKYKNHRILIKAVSSIGKKNPELLKHLRIHLTLNKEEAYSITEVIIKKGLEQNFIFHGTIPHNELISMLKSAMALLFPSRIETIGLPLIEAAALGRRILTSNLPYAHQVLKNYEGAIYINSAEYEAWAMAIKAECDNEPREFQRMVMPLQSSWEEFFSIVNEKISAIDSVY